MLHNKWLKPCLAVHDEYSFSICMYVNICLCVCVLSFVWYAMKTTSILDSNEIASRQYTRGCCCCCMTNQPQQPCARGASIAS